MMAKVPVPCSNRPPLEIRKPPQLSMEKRQTETAFRKGSNKLRDPKPLLKLAQHELKTGGTLGCCVQHLREASSLRMEGQPLPPLVLEKLLYQALVRCIEEKDFGMGVEVSKLFCGCLGGGGNSYPSLHFPPPVPEATMDTSRLVTGAIINTSRCCLELGETQYLHCIVELCKNCDCWLGTVEGQTAAGYRCVCVCVCLHLSQCICNSQYRHCLIALSSPFPNPLNSFPIQGTDVSYSLAGGCNICC